MAEVEDMAAGFGGSVFGYGIGWGIYEMFRVKTVEVLSPPSIESAILAIHSLVFEAFAVSVFIGSLCLLGSSIGSLFERHEKASLGVSGFLVTIIRGAVPFGLFDLSSGIYGYDLLNSANAIIGTFYLLLLFVGVGIALISSYILYKNW